MRVLRRSGISGPIGVLLTAVLGIGLMPFSADAQNYAQRATQARTASAGSGGQTNAGATRYAPARQTRAVGTLGATGAAQAGYSVGTNLYGTSPRPVAASASLGGLRQALTHFYLDMGRMPLTTEGLNVLLYAPPGARNWNGPYISVVSGPPPFTDPWGNQYQFINTTRGGRPSFLIRSRGPDGVFNTADDLSVAG